MSPEQTQGLALDARSDVYSFGVMLHELLAGRRASGQKEALPPLGEEIPADLRTSVAKALEARARRSLSDRCAIWWWTCVGSCAGRTRSCADGPRPATPRTRAPDLRCRCRASRSIGSGTSPPVSRCSRCWGSRHARRFFSSRSASSVVVLPFVNESGAAADVPISEGLGDDLRDRLMAVPGLSVQARASSISFRDQDADMPTIAATLGVGRLVNGILRRQGQTAPGSRRGTGRSRFCYPDSAPVPRSRNRACR